MFSFKQIEEGIHNHICTSSLKNFPRKVAGINTWQITVNNFNELMTNFKFSRNTSNFYASVFSEVQIKKSIWDKTYVDIDYKFLNFARKEMLLFNNHMVEYYDCEPRIVFTANKGFGIYIDFPDTEIDYIKVYTFIERIGQLLELKCLDLKVTKDFCRVSRVPYSINFNRVVSGRNSMLCVPVNPKWSLSAMLQEAKKCKFRQEIVIEKNKEIAKVIKRMVIIEPKYKKCSVGKIDSDILKRLLHYAKRINDGRHRLLMYIIIPLMIRNENSNKEIHNYCNALITKSGENYGKYIKNVDYHIARNRVSCYPPKSIERFLSDNPDIFDSLSE